MPRAIVRSDIVAARVEGFPWHAHATHRTTRLDKQPRDNITNKHDEDIRSLLVLTNPGLYMGLRGVTADPDNGGSTQYSALNANQEHCM